MRVEARSCVKTVLALTGFVSLAFLSLVGCGRGSGPSREVLGDLNGVWRVVGGRQPWDLTISSSGQHMAIKRSVRDPENINRIYKRVELDGKPGPNFSEIFDWHWSRDGSALVYTANGIRERPGHYLVYGVAPYGPFDELGPVTMSPDGQKWAAWVSRPGMKGKPRELLVNGTIRQVAWRVDWDSVWRATSSPDEMFYFDETAQEFALSVGERKWKTIDGREAQWQARPPSAKAPLPPGISIRMRVGVTKTTLDGYPRWRRELLLNGRSLGEYDHIFNAPAMDPTKKTLKDAPFTGFPQPDGTVIFYVIENGKVTRVRARPTL